MLGGISFRTHSTTFGNFTEFYSSEARSDFSFLLTVKKQNKDVWVNLNVNICRSSNADGKRSIIAIRKL